ncbi:helix-turn-helix domain-containing protein [Saccharophagus degradans]|nr:helix-turn-helix domain-containing protein [Saccharophagus degradans]MBU2983844.1 helix-turn-helix domain-containing protein [Saccharophagus degradans]
MAYQWLKVLVAILTTNAISELLINWEISLGKPLAKSTFMHITAFLFLGINLVITYFALQRHPLWDWMLEHTQHSNPSKTKGGNSSEETKRLLKQFMQQLNNQQWFKEEAGFTIAMAARALNIPQRQLSEAINAETGLSYSQLMNKRRVEEAVTMMSEHPEKSLTAVMYEAGFRTKSSFNREFSRVTGKSPSEYQQLKHSIQSV